MALPPVVLTVAGFDPTSGAGATADLLTLAALGCHGVACLTALTVQSTTGVRRVEPLSPGLLLKTLEELVSDLPPAAVRIGMLGSRDVASVLADFLERRPLPHVVLDPVLRSSSGMELLEAGGIKVLLDRLMPLAEVITPNLEEAATLSGLEVKDLREGRLAARALQERGARAVVVTGGHLEPPADLLSMSGLNGGQEEVEFPGEMLVPGAHGTGCAFATALAARLALGSELASAVREAGEHVRGGLRKARNLGRGARLLDPFWRRSG